MPASVMATTADLASTINKGVPAVVHTPPAVTTSAHPDFTNKNTGRTQTSHQTFLTTQQHQGR